MTAFQEIIDYSITVSALRELEREFDRLTERERAVAELSFRLGMEHIHDYTLQLEKELEGLTSEDYDPIQGAPSTSE